MAFVIALFGEAERGEFQKGELCYSLDQLVDRFGHPPKESQGLHFAVQALLFKKNILFYRVREEGFSYSDYLRGLQQLRDAEISQLGALCLPGVGDEEIIEATQEVCTRHHSLLIMTEADLYDYLTQNSVC